MGPHSGVSTGNDAETLESESSLRQEEATAVFHRAMSARRSDLSQKRCIEAKIFEDKEMGVRSFMFRDNDGNLIQFFTQNK